MPEGNKWERRRENPIEWMRGFWPDADLSHITFNPKVEKQYRIRRQGGSDGTLALVHADMQEALLPLVNMQTFYKPDQPDCDLTGVRRIEYEVGLMSWVTGYGRIRLRCGGVHNGEIDRFSIPVRATLIRE